MSRHRSLPLPPLAVRVSSTFLIQVLSIGTLITFALANDVALARTLEGRVESVEHSAEPQFPMEAILSEMPPGRLPDEIAGTWYGKVEIAQLEYYARLHRGEPYCERFLQEVSQLFHVGQPGEVMLSFKRSKNGEVTLMSSDVILKGRMRLQMTAGKGPAAVPGGFNVPTTAANRVRLVEHGVENTRIDDVRIVDASGATIHNGFTEISAQYLFDSPKRMSIKMLEIDYDSQHKPLWKILIRGTANR